IGLVVSLGLYLRLRTVTRSPRQATRRTKGRSRSKRLASTAESQCAEGRTEDPKWFLRLPWRHGVARTPAPALCVGGCGCWGAGRSSQPDEVFEWTTGGATGEVAEFLTGTRTAAHVHRSLQVVLFADIAESTSRVVAMGDDAWRDLLSDFRSLVRTELDRYDGREVSTRGDDFFAVVGSPSVAVEIARAIKSAAATLGLRVRCGVHLGEVEHHGDDFTGIAVHIAARIVAVAQPDEILVNQTVRDALIG